MQEKLRVERTLQARQHCDLDDDGWGNVRTMCDDELEDIDE